MNAISFIRVSTGQGHESHGVGSGHGGIASGPAMTGVGLETPLLRYRDREGWDEKQNGNRTRIPESCGSTVAGGGEGFVVLPLFHQTRPTVSS